MKPLTYDQLHEAVKNKEISSAKDKDGNNFRLFNATNGLLCYFPKGRSRSGYKVSIDLFNSFVTFKAPALPKTEADKKKEQYNVIEKYRNMALKSLFTNDFIERCKNLPPSFSHWLGQGAKNLYELEITTGNKIDGKVISLNRIAKQYPGAIQSLREAIRTQTAKRIISNERFAGYDMTISTEIKENGEFYGYLSLEYKGCGNGYYYTLINDDNFIGCDVD